MWWYWTARRAFLGERKHGVFTAWASLLYLRGQKELGLRQADRSALPVRLIGAGQRYVEGVWEMTVLKDELGREMAERN